MSEQKTRRKFDKALLDECIARDGATLIGEYDKLTRESIIEFNCKCGIKDNKKMIQLCDFGGSYCLSCIQNNKTAKIKYTRQNNIDPEKSIAKTHLEISKEWHPTKNGILTPEMFSSGSTKKVWWLCKNTCSHGCLHEYESSISKRCGVDKTGGVFCSKPVKKICEHMSISYTHPEIAKEWHPTKNGTLKPIEVTSGSGLKVWWLCPKTCTHGCPHEYQSIIAQRCTKNSQCQYCIPNPMKMCEHMSIVYTHPEIAKLWHPTKNGDLKPEKFTSGSHKKVWWLCAKKSQKGTPHEFERVIYHMTSADYICPFCSSFGVSLGQVEWLEYIQRKYNLDIIFKGGKHNREEKFNFNNKSFKSDGYCKDLNKIYEYLGCYWHGCPKCFLPDKINSNSKKTMFKLYEEFEERKKLFEENGYSLEYIWECEWNKMKLNKQI